VIVLPTPRGALDALPDFGKITPTGRELDPARDGFERMTT